MKPIRRTLVLLGDSGVGKSSLIAFLKLGSLPDHFEWYYASNGEKLVIANKTIELGIWDPAAMEARDHRLYPPNAIYFLCFSVVDRKSFLNVTRRWIPEVLHFCPPPRSQILLVGCKTDLRGREVQRDGIRGELEMVMSEEGHALAAHIGAVEYLECSAKLGKGVQELLVSAGELAASYNPSLLSPDSHACRVL